ncbi:MAG: hypothetical protein QM796_13135 [Chthoniobacteraceae bacterium]
MEIFAEYFVMPNSITGVVALIQEWEAFITGINGISSFRISPFLVAENGAYGRFFEIHW